MQQNNIWFYPKLPHIMYVDKNKKGQQNKQKKKPFYIVPVLLKTWPIAKTKAFF